MRGGSYLKKVPAPQSVSARHFEKPGEVGWVAGSAPAQFSDWLMAREQGGVTWVSISP